MTTLPHAQAISGALDRAVERKELFMVYQPKLVLGDGTLAGVEALMRWQSAQFGLVLPSMFIPIAERSGAIDEITEWGLREVLRQSLSWTQQGLTANIAFNISALSLRDVHLPDFIERMCQIEGMACDNLTIEVTEGATQHVIRLLDTITRFRIKGMGVELDDFGTGYSSLLQLRQLPYTGVKIDRCFVRDVASDPEARLIVSCVIQLAHGLGLTATAEGVEDQATLDVLMELGCDRAQGFLIAEPMAGRDFAYWLLGPGAEWRWRLAPSDQLGTAA